MTHYYARWLYGDVALPDLAPVADDETPEFVIYTTSLQTGGGIGFFFEVAPTIIVTGFSFSTIEVPCAFALTVSTGGAIAPRDSSA